LHNLDFYEMYETRSDAFHHMNTNTLAAL
jgi:hypothetical protein